MKKLLYAYCTILLIKNNNHSFFIVRLKHKQYIILMFYIIKVHLLFILVVNLNKTNSEITKLPLVNENIPFSLFFRSTF
jgi:hypothetical protein